jgi:hypothetical protein
MGREFYSQAVLKAYCVKGAFVCEDIIPLGQFDKEGADLLISKERRLKDGIRFISVRTFDSEGKRRVDWRLRYDAEGALLPQK